MRSGRGRNRIQRRGREEFSRELLDEVARPISFTFNFFYLMENRIAPRLLLLVALVLAPAIFAAETPKMDPYTQAVASYVEAAGVQLAAIRESVVASTADATDELKQRYADVVRRLDTCDDYVRRLKVASQKDFDPLKAEFEKARAEMVKTLETARKTV